MNRFSVIALVALLPLATACKKKTDNAGTTAGSGSATVTVPAGSAGSAAAEGSAAMGSGSAAAEGSAAAAGSAAGSAAAVVVPPPPAGKIAVIRGGNDNGQFDGDKALYIDAKGRREVAVPKNCEKFTCAAMNKDGVNADKLQKVCPNASWMEIKLDAGDPPAAAKAGPVKVDIYVGSFMSGGGLDSDFTAGSELTEVKADKISGKIELKDGDSEAHGTFTAKPCKI